MRAYIIRRLLISVPLVFLAINQNPDAALKKYEMSPTISFQFVEQEKERLGIYDPLPVRYLRWLGGVLFDVQFGRETRALASFTDPGKLSSEFGVGIGWTVPVDQGVLTETDEPLSLGDHLAPDGELEKVIPRMASLSIALSTDGDKPAQVKLVVRGSSAAEKDKAAEMTLPATVVPDKGGRLVLTGRTLRQQLILPDTVKTIEL
ncbi:MAG: hypothetical protein ACOCXX_03110, partial [Planctomycetota bacterium]